MKLKNKVAIITGSAGKMGKALALEFAKQGARIVVCDINAKECREISKQINHLGSEAISIKC
ncbi:MAG TPA: SDR family NAD(P)-dependent oxidoreductase, partial [Candidatus Nanoarchaeia archaeon]|nr:SDR family NAD(P)-dependent oxidoreductase [Candidatus Nanoarchaeia archaeon]